MLADVSKLEVTPVLFPSLSFISQPRNEKQEIKKLLTDAGIQQGSNVGIVGWKYFTKADAMEGAFEAPHYLVEAVRQIAGKKNVTNQTQIFMKRGDVWHCSYRGVQDATEFGGRKDVDFDFPGF